MEEIHFFYEDITPLNNFPEDHIKSWITTIVHSYKHSIGEINYIFCSDNYILDINNTYLSHDYFTDIITFDNRDELANKELMADIFISIETVQSNSTQFNTAFNDELHRVIIHGIHHLLGQSDKTETEAEEMRKREEASLSLRQF